MRALELSPIAAVIVSLASVPTFAAGPKTPKTTTHGNPHTATTATTPTTTKTSSTHTTHGPSTHSHKTSPTTLNPIAQKIASKPQLKSKITALIPSGMTLNQASRGFKNQGQFIAALHVSHNLNIPFADLKTAMTGINPTAPKGTPPSDAPRLSLGQAIQKLRPGADSRTASTTAEHEASRDLSPTTSSSTPTTTTTTTTKKSAR